MSQSWLAGHGVSGWEAAGRAAPAGSGGAGVGSSRFRARGQRDSAPGRRQDGDGTSSPRPRESELEAWGASLPGKGSRNCNRQQMCCFKVQRSWDGLFAGIFPFLAETGPLPVCGLCRQVPRGPQPEALMSLVTQQTPGSGCLLPPCVGRVGGRGWAGEQNQPAWPRAALGDRPSPIPPQGREPPEGLFSWGREATAPRSLQPEEPREGLGGGARAPRPAQLGRVQPTSASGAVPGRPDPAPPSPRPGRLVPAPLGCVLGLSQGTRAPRGRWGVGLGRASDEEGAGQRRPGPALTPAWARVGGAELPQLL